MTIAAAVLALAALAGDGPAAAGPAAMKVHAGPLEKVLADAKAGGKVVLLDFHTDT